jgi:hypothetical protein
VVKVLYKLGSLILSQVFESKQNQFSRKGAKLAKKGQALALKPGFKDFLCVLCGFARDAFVFDFASVV